MYCIIAFPADLNQTFTYKIPENLQDKLQPGMRVKASFGPRAQVGYCVALSSSVDEKIISKIKPIQDVLDKKPIFTPELLELITWISSYYLAPIGMCFKAAHPMEGGFKRSPHCFRNPDAAESDWPFIPPQGISTLDFVSLDLPIQEKIKQGLASGDLYIDNVFPQAKKVSTVQAVRLFDRDAEVTDRQQEVVDYLKSINEPVEAIRDIQKRTGISRAVINTMVKNEVLHKCTLEVESDPFGENIPLRHRNVQFTDDQKRVIDHIHARAGKFYPVCLHGVPGSGKTEVYLELAKRQIENGKSVIICVPEIAITPQIAARFRAVFGKKVAIWHSQMSDAERLWTWSRMLQGSIKAVVGARSALFSPLKNIGLIVVDEEQESSYKQDDKTPRYHGRDTAVKYAHILGVPVILGSATPSLETYYLSALGRYERLELNQRFGNAVFPQVELVDMTKADRRGIFSESLLENIYDALDKKEQILLLQNRRGFHTIISCTACGHVLQCPSCSVSLTYHKRLGKLMCHACNRTFDTPEKCPSCGKRTLSSGGTGTQKIEDEMAALFPQARIARMDVDTTRTKSAHAKILKQFEERDYDILLGTQMIAKGLDFPNVTLVGVINADAGMGIPDYRAGERLFQLIYQVAGRSGRGDKPGKAVIQTYNPEHAAIDHAAKLELRQFYNLELYQRKMLNYPPFSRLFLCRITGENGEAVQKLASALAGEMMRHLSSECVLGPAPAASEKIRNVYRWQILIKAGRHEDPNGNRTAAVLAQIVNKFKYHDRQCRIFINRDPISLM